MYKKRKIYISLVLALVFVVSSVGLAFAETEGPTRCPYCGVNAWYMDCISSVTKTSNGWHIYFSGIVPKGCTTTKYYYDSNYWCDNCGRTARNEHLHKITHGSCGSATEYIH